MIKITYGKKGINVTVGIINETILDSIGLTIHLFKYLYTKEYVAFGFVMQILFPDFYRNLILLKILLYLTDALFIIYFLLFLL